MTDSSGKELVKELLEKMNESDSIKEKMKIFHKFPENLETKAEIDLVCELHDMHDEIGILYSKILYVFWPSKYLEELTAVFNRWDELRKE